LRLGNQGWFQTVGIIAGERFHQRGLAVIDVAAVR
jgi:hypothetical protein